jgi:hypothetical protein
MRGNAVNLQILKNDKHLCDVARVELQSTTIPRRFSDNPIIAKPDAIGVFRTAHFFDAVGKWIFSQTFNRSDDFVHRDGRQLP